LTTCIRKGISLNGQSDNEIIYLVSEMSDDQRMKETSKKYYKPNAKLIYYIENILSHWVLIIIEMESNKSYFIDSKYDRDQTDQYLKNSLLRTNKLIQLYSVIDSTVDANNHQFYLVSRASKQLNGVDYGIYVINIVQCKHNKSLFHIFNYNSHSKRYRFCNVK
jgi:hypothetical protein